MTSFFPVNKKEILLSPKERRTLIRNLQNEIERLEQWYFDRESRIKGDILVFDTENDYSSPKIMTLKERAFNEKRTKIQQLESLKWKQRFCVECNKYKNQEEFQTRESICRNCYSETLRAKREEIMKRNSARGNLKFALELLSEEVDWRSPVTRTESSEISWSRQRKVEKK